MRLIIKNNVIYSFHNNWMLSIKKVKNIFIMLYVGSIKYSLIQYKWNLMKKIYSHLICWLHKGLVSYHLSTVNRTKKHILHTTERKKNKFNVKLTCLSCLCIFTEQKQSYLFTKNDRRISYMKQAHSFSLCHQC